MLQILYRDGRLQFPSSCKILRSTNKGKNETKYKALQDHNPARPMIIGDTDLGNIGGLTVSIFLQSVLRKAIGAGERSGQKTIQPEQVLDQIVKRSNVFSEYEKSEALRSIEEYLQVVYREKARSRATALLVS